MKERSFHIADTLKTAFIDFVLTQFGEDVVIGHEIMYGSSGRIADLVILYKGDTYAIEVKSDSDCKWVTMYFSIFLYSISTLFL